MKRVVVILISLAATSACLDWENGIPCRTTNHCPANTVCQEAVCVPAGAASDAGTNADGGARPDGG